MVKIKYGVSLGTMWQHPNGTYYARWQDNSKNRRKSLDTKDLTIARRRLRSFQRDLVNGRIDPPSKNKNVCLYDFVDEFNNFVNISKRTASTCELYQVALDKAKDCWGNIPLREISYKHLDDLKTYMLKKGLAAATVNKNYRHVKGALNKAMKWDYIDKGTLEFPGFEQEEERTRYLGNKELQELTAASDDDDIRDMILLSAYTGLRVGELLRLTVHDVDNPVGKLRIVSKQKNKKDSRIPISKKASEIISRCIERHPNDKLFRFYSRSWVSRLVKENMERAGLDNRFHDLRHTFGSHLAMKGVPLKAIQELMRHESYESTLVYAKFSPDALAEMAENLDYGEGAEEDKIDGGDV